MTPADGSMPRPAAEAAGAMPAATRRAGFALASGVLLGLAALYGAAVVLVADMDRLVGRTFDDACYYLEIARNAAAGMGMTFDGIHATNGFHPLWAFALVPLYQAFQGTPEAGLRLALMVQVALLVASLALLDRTLAPRFGPRVRFLVLLAAVFIASYPALNGMESPLVMLTLVMILATAWTDPGAGWRRVRHHALVGALCGIAVLARLDLGFLLAAAALAAGIERAGGRWRLRAGGAALLAGAALVLAPYLAYNLMTTGHAVPISGQLKSTFPALAPGVALLDRFGIRHLVYLAIGAIYLALYLATRRHDPVARRTGQLRDPRLDRFDALMSVAAAAMLAHAAYSFLFMEWGVFRWHFLWYGLFAAVALARPLRRLDAWPAARADAAAAALAALALAGGTWLHGRHVLRPPAYDWHRAAYDAARWARAHTPRDAVFAMHDAGVFGYFSDRRVINLDGVVNDLEYQRWLRDRKLAVYLRANHVAYLVDHQAGKHADLAGYRWMPYRVYSRKYRAWSDTLMLARASEAYRGRVYRHEGAHAVACVIWRLEPAAAAPDGAPPATRPGAERARLAAR